MNERMRKSFPAKLSALGFIALTLLGNYWLVGAVLAQPAPSWLMNAIALAAFWTLLSGVWLALYALMAGLRQKD